MAVPVKVSDRLLTLAREEARSTHRSATAQIEHWATLGRAVEVLASYQDVLALKRAGQTLPVPAAVAREEAHALFQRLVGDPAREGVKARIRAGATTMYAIDPRQPGVIVAIEPEGVPAAALEGDRILAARRVAARRKLPRRK